MYWCTIIRKLFCATCSWLFQSLGIWFIVSQGLNWGKHPSPGKGQGACELKPQPLMLTTDLFTDRQSPQNARLIDSSYISVQRISVTARRQLLQRRWRSVGRVDFQEDQAVANGWSHTNQLPSSLRVLSFLFSELFYGELFNACPSKCLLFWLWTKSAEISYKRS